MAALGAGSVQLPSHFTCANGVKLLHVGADETDPKPGMGSFKYPTPNRHRHNDLDNILLRNVSDGLSFTEDVVKERCFHAVPYHPKYFYEALDVSGLIKQPHRVSGLTGRHNNRGSDKKHLPCNLTKLAAHKLKPIKRPIQDRINKQDEAKPKDIPQVSKHSSIFMTEPEIETEDKGADPEQQWDEYLVSILSESTARWIVHTRMAANDQQEKLKSLLNIYHGTIGDQEVELVEDKAPEGDKTDRSKLSSQGPTRPWKKPDQEFVEKVRAEKESLFGFESDEDENNVAFYRLPAAVRRAHKLHRQQQKGAINATAHNIEVKRIEPPPPTTLRELMNPRIRDTIYDPQNMFQRERLSGAQQVHITSETTSNQILLDTKNKYSKVLRSDVPRAMEVWWPGPSQRGNAKVTKQTRGMHRWSDLPRSMDRDLTMAVDVEELCDMQETGETGTLPAGHDRLMLKTPGLQFSTQARQNSTLVQIVNEWRSKWNLDMRYADATMEDLVRDMGDMHVQVRLTAITTCARAAEYKPPAELGIHIGPSSLQKNKAKLLPEELFIALGHCLDDRHEQVKMAAAIALYTLERPNDKAEVLLRRALMSGNSADRWAAAQCLAYYEECDSQVVEELLNQLLTTYDSLRHERAAFLLSKLSESSTLVHSMVGEQLNSSNWQHRVLACKLLPRLKGQINKDLTNKLTQLMWGDWNSDVRKAAAQSLGKTGRGKDVHDELLKRLQHGDDAQRLEAVSKIGQLGIMTGKLLPAFLQCFHDDFVSVRAEVCRACINLCIKDRNVLDKLVFLATYDPICKAKAIAIQTIGALGMSTDKVRECILWALRYEDQPAVRAEACRSTVLLGYTDNEVAQILQDRLLVEASPIVRREMQSALEKLGISAMADMDTVTRIKEEVRKLSNKENIAAAIAEQEREQEIQARMARMIYQEEEQETPKETKQSRSSQRSRCRAFTPDRASSRGTATLADVFSRPDMNDSDSRSERSARTLDSEEDLDLETQSGMTLRSAMSRILEEQDELSSPGPSQTWDISPSPHPSRLTADLSPTPRTSRLSGMSSSQGRHDGGTSMKVNSRHNADTRQASDRSEVNINTNARNKSPQDNTGQDLQYTDSEVRPSPSHTSPEGMSTQHKPYETSPASERTPDPHQDTTGSIKSVEQPLGALADTKGALDVSLGARNVSPEMGEVRSSRAHTPPAELDADAAAAVGSDANQDSTTEDAAGPLDTKLQTAASADITRLHQQPAPEDVHRGSMGTQGTP